MGEIRDIKKLFSNFNNLVSEFDLGLDLYLSVDKAIEFKKLALSTKGLNDKKNEIISLFNAVAEKKEWLTLLVGSKASPSKMFGEE